MNLHKAPLFQTLIFRILGVFFTDKTLHKIFDSGSLKRGVFATYDLINSSEMTPTFNLLPENNIGIVVQGPINNRYTKNVCAFLVRTNPDAKVVLSTWNDQDIREYEKFFGENFYIIQSPKPKNPGPSNINLQIVSTISGIEKLQSLGCTQILKMRTDTILANPQFLKYLIWMADKGDEKAIVFSSFNSFLFRLFSVTDQIMFGSTSNMRKYWNVELPSTAGSTDFPEKFLFKRYLKLQGFECTETLESYLDALRRFTVIADHEQLGQIWNKGAYTGLNYRWRGSSFPHPMCQLTTWMWELINIDDSYIKELYRNLSSA